MYICPAHDIEMFSSQIGSVIFENDLTCLSKKCHSHLKFDKSGNILVFEFKFSDGNKIIGSNAELIWLDNRDYHELPPMMIKEYTLEELNKVKEKAERLVCFL